MNSCANSEIYLYLFMKKYFLNSESMVEIAINNIYN